MAKEIRAIPPPPKTDDPALNRWIQAVSEALRLEGEENTEIRQKVTTAEKAASEADEKAEENKSGMVTDDPPPAPQSLQIAELELHNILVWDRPEFLGYAYTEIYRSSSDNLSTTDIDNMDPYMTAAGRVASDQVESDVTYYYWIRFVKNFEGTLIPGPVNSTSGTKGTPQKLGDNGLSGLDAGKLFTNVSITSENIVGTLDVATAIIGEKLESYGFVSGSSGWQILGNGSAEFQNVTARGDIEASSLEAGTAMVDTLNLNGQSVTFPKSVYSGGAKSVALSGTAVQSLSLTTSSAGAPIFISASCVIKLNAFHSGGSMYAFYNVGNTRAKIVRSGDGGTEVIYDGKIFGREPGTTNPSSDDFYDATWCSAGINVADSPGANKNIQYDLIISGDNGGPQKAEARSILALELKR